MMNVYFEGEKKSDLLGIVNSEHVNHDSIVLTPILVKGKF